MKAPVYDLTGKQTSEKDLSPVLFEANVSTDLMHKAVVLRLANKRNPIAHTLTRGEVAATTKKAFKQKGTGRARRGALSTNLLRGGGVTHGPRNTRNFTKRMNKRERRAALFSSLSLRAQDECIICLDASKLETPSTKSIASVMAKMSESTKYLFVVDGKGTVEKSIRNIKNARIVYSQYLNPYDVLWAEKVCFVDGALENVQSIFNNKA